jgi:16S rRNA (uracil1498-N3)-methyltransferase
MSRTNRFFLPPDRWSAPFTLEGSEAHHLTTVLRAEPGEHVVLFNGQGKEGRFRVVSHSKKKVILDQETSREHQQPDCRLWIAPGWNRATRRGWFLEKAAELGAWGIIFWQSAFSQGKTPEQPKETWQNQCIAAAKQCGNPWLPQLLTYPQGLGQLLEATAHFQTRIFLWENPSCPRILNADDITCQGDVLVILGPEGGFSDDETAVLQQATCSPFSLGNRILRWETAALLCLGIHFWNDQILRQSQCNP